MKLLRNLAKTSPIEAKGFEMLSRLANGTEFEGTGD
jgi:hypothetical protein